MSSRMRSIRTLSRRLTTTEIRLGNNLPTMERTAVSNLARTPRILQRRGRRSALTIVVTRERTALTRERTA